MEAPVCASCLARGEARPDDSPSLREDTLRGGWSGERRQEGTRHERGEEPTRTEHATSLGRYKHYDAAVPATCMVRNITEGREGHGHL
jgi:hypothetical protein